MADAVASVDGPAAQQARWVLTHALAEEAPANLDAHFAEPLVHDGGAALRATFDTVRADGPWRAVAARASGSGHSVDLVIESRRGAHLSMHVTVDERGRAVLFWFGSAIDPAADVSTPVARRLVLEQLPVRSTLAVGRIDSGRCVDLRTEGSDPDEALPLASVAKLLLLPVLFDRVAAGTLAWDTVLTLNEESRSLPAGSLAVAPAGTTVTVQDALLAVLQESDNTAADLLLDAVGREQVQALYDELAGADGPRPFWLTREVFALGWGPTAVVGVQPDPAAIDALRATVAGPLTTSVLEVTTPRWQNGVDWFLAPAGLCELGARLHERWGTLPAAVRDAVAGDGVLLAKPGGAPGVVTGFWLVENDRGAAVVTAQFAAEVATAVGDAAGMLSLGEALVAEVRAAEGSA